MALFRRVRIKTSIVLPATNSRHATPVFTADDFLGSDGDSGDEYEESSDEENEESSDEENDYESGDDSVLGPHRDKQRWVDKS
jgi:hypothetical protein